MSKAQPANLKQKVRKHWNENPMDYDTVHAPLGSKEYYNQINQQFYEVCYFGQDKGQPIFSKIINYSKLKGKKVLEIGCGSGTIARQLAASGAIFTAVDLTPQAIANTKKQLEFAHLKADVREADAENLPFKDETFDFVWSWGVIHHTPDTPKAASEIYRVLKKGGQASIMIYHKNSLFYYGAVMFFRGIIQGRLFKMSAQKLLNLYTDHGHKGGTPLAKCYTKRQARKMFNKFSDIRFSVYGLKNEVYVIPFLRPLCYKLPNFIPNSILRFFGWYLMIRAKK